MRVWVVCLMLVPSLALAKQTGIATTNCFGCHGGGLAAPTVTLTGPSQTIAAGATVMFTVTVSGAISNAGFFLSSNQAGTLTAGAGTRLFTEGIGHSTPRAASGGTVTWQLVWTAPSTPGGAELELSVVGGNANGASSGDRPGSASLSIAWGCTPVAYRADADGDGHGDPATGPYLRCGPSAGLSALGDDCNDRDPLVFPGAVEACNGRDDNCNGTSDEGLGAVSTWADLDGDGYGDRSGASQLGCATSKRAANNTDCDDTDAGIFPGAVEVCNQRDDDCDGMTDENVRVTCGRGWCGRFGPSCDPAQCTPGPPMKELCNRFDDDCDGVIDNDEPCGAGIMCFEGRCYSVDPPADAGPVVDAGVVDAGTTDAGMSGVDAGSEAMTPEPCGCHTAGAVPLLLLALTRSSASRRPRSRRVPPLGGP